MDIVQLKQTKIRRFHYNLGKLIVDVTKLYFGSLVLGTVIKGDISQSTLLIGGIVASGIGAFIGVTLVTLCEEK